MLVMTFLYTMKLISFSQFAILGENTPHEDFDNYMINEIEIHALIMEKE